jgi:predicted helicase
MVFHKITIFAAEYCARFFRKTPAKMTIPAYLDTLNRRFQSGIAKEHAYRTDFEQLLRALAPGMEVTNEPSNVTDCGNPDFVITKGKIPLGYIEAKDIGKDLNGKNYQEQFGRYRKALDNLIITDYLWFQFYQNGALTHEIRIGEIANGKIKALPERFDHFANLIADFCSFTGQTIKSPQKLAALMAAKARLLQNILEHAATDDENSQANTELKAQLNAFKQVLIHDISPRAFADLYAQTMAYGMFAARLHDRTLDTFTRQEAAELIPKTNPFLRKLFGHIAGPDIDDRIRPVVDNLADVFRATDVAALLADFGYASGRSSPEGGGREGVDPIIHFYETFLAEYDPALRKSRGVWYTPEPVVNFIVRAVDDILKTDFNLPQGLADTAKIKIKVNTQNPDKRSATGFKQEEREVHRVQLLDPATGTGTFLAEVIKYLHQTRFQSMPGIWSSYVDEHLIPRLHGFELLMASYAMAHLKLDLLLKETGYTPTRDQRFKVYLTNSLEEFHPDTGTLFASWLSAEANEANYIKRDTPVMVVLGNPPYSGESANKGAWIMKLMEDYKQEPGGGKLQEKNSKWINDDYVKFIRYGQYFIEQNEEGILAFITNHSFLDNPTFRGMRWNLLNTFDKVYILDLHGNSKKKESAPDGSIDQNVFDIQQGVSINLFIKTGRKKQGALAAVYHLDVFGPRENKYRLLWDNNLTSIRFKELQLTPPHYFYAGKDFDILEQYERGFQVNALFPVNSVGIVTARDAFTIHAAPEDVKATLERFLALDNEAARREFDLGEDVRDWSVEMAKADLKRSGPDFVNIVPINYRPFDIRFTYFTGKSKGFHCMPRGEVMQHFLKGENVGLLVPKAFRDRYFAHAFVVKNISEAIYLSSLTGSNAMNFPLYLYPATTDGLFTPSARRPNLNMEIVGEIERRLGIPFVPEKGPESGVFAPVDLLDYIYAVLHSPAYREKYKEFLKIDFPRVPYPEDAATFWRMVTYGGALRALHLMESPRLDQFITTYPASGDNVVGKIRYEAGRAYINDTQYFEGVPESAWNFYIGGYQPAQKWLKDRKGRALKFEDILHYQRMVVALAETERLMAEIDGEKR